jgi:hypothetical protein
MSQKSPDVRKPSHRRPSVSSPRASIGHSFAATERMFPCRTPMYGPMSRVREARRLSAAKRGAIRRPRRFVLASVPPRPGHTEVPEVGRFGI